MKKALLALSSAVLLAACSSPSSQIPKDLEKYHSIAEPEVVWSKDIADNYQRLNIHDLDAAVKCDAIRITALSTHGIDSARIYEVRAY